MHPSPRFRTLAQLATSASCLCLGLAFACGDTTENDDPGGDTTSGSTTNAGPTNGGTTTGGTTTGGGGTTGSDCPSLEPAAGAGCPSDGLVCAYANCTAPDYRDYHSLDCVNGAWVLAVTEACEVGCPTEPAIVRAGCDVGLTPGPCPAVDACGDAQEVVCTDGIWEITGAKVPEQPGAGGAVAGAPVCPATPPESDSRCCPRTAPERCDYRESATDGAAGAPFIILPVTSTGGAADAPYLLQCAVCTEEMVWTSCPLE